MVKSFQGFAVSAFFIVRSASTERSRLGEVLHLFAMSAFFEKKKTLTVIKQWDCQLTNGFCRFVPRRTCVPIGRDVVFTLKEYL